TPEKFRRLFCGLLDKMETLKIYHPESDIPQNSCAFGPTRCRSCSRATGCRALLLPVGSRPILLVRCEDINRRLRGQCLCDGVRSTKEHGFKVMLLQSLRCFAPYLLGVI